MDVVELFVNRQWNYDGLTSIKWDNVKSIVWTRFFDLQIRKSRAHWFAQWHTEFHRHTWQDSIFLRNPETVYVWGAGHFNGPSFRHARVGILLRNAKHLD